MAVLALCLAALVPVAVRVEVAGTSMLPTLSPGERLLALRRRSYRVGDLVVFVDPEQPDRLLVKRVSALRPHGVEVLGDNEVASRDSRQFGTVARSRIKGVVWYRYAPPAQRGVLARPVRRRAGRR